MKNRKQVRVSRLALGLIAALAAAPVIAQTTSASLGGRITGADDAPVTGAQVTILHTPSGTLSRATTDANGRYSARGLRVGGPYTITIDSNGRTETRENVYLSLSEANNVDASVGGADATTLAAIEVVGVADTTIFSPNKMGAGSTVNRAQIESFPSINRNIQDYVRLDPRVAQTDKARNEISVGGQNSRYNAIRIDGISTNDTFGIEANGLPTPRQPFSLDVIEEISVDVANYDVTISGGVGGVINAVTKSGTNEFHGSVYGLYRDNSMVRENEDGSDFSGFEDEKTYGMTFGGPLIKDRLFFFLNYEKFEQAAPGPTFGPIGSGASNIVGITPEEIAQIQQIARDVYGFDAGSSGVPSNADTTAEEFGLKIDWNINEDHRAVFRYGQSEQSVAIFDNFNNTNIALSSHAYTQDYEFKTYSAQLYSDWTDNFSTEAKISYRDYSVIRNPVTNLPEVAVRVGNNTVNFGTEENTHVNILETETLNAFFAGTLLVDDHELKFGFDYEDNDILNLFGRRTNGVYVFNSIEDFAAGTSSRYQLFAPTDGDLDNMTAIWGLKNLGLFLQDTWSVNDNLTLTFGLRYDEPMVDEDPAFNAAAQAAFGFDNSSTIDGNGLFEPRFGFNYTFDTERPTQLRGGFGLFQGAAANVWLSNSFTNTGQGFTDFLFSSGIDEFSPDPAEQLGLVNNDDSGVEGAQAVDFIDPDLGQPSVWKANLAIDHELPFWGVVGSAELVLTSVKEAIFYQQLNLGAPTTVGQDGRLIFWDEGGRNPANWNVNGAQPSGARVNDRANANPAFTDAIIARPTDKGESQQLTVSLQKAFQDSDWYWQVAYTYTHATEASPLTSSTSASQWGNSSTFDPNEEVASTSSYEIRNRFTAALVWRHNFFDDYKTEVSMFYEGRSGKPYSYVFDNDANGDGRFGNDLLYIPTGPGDVLFGSAAEEAAFFEFVANDPYLSAHQGQVAERNAAHSTWVNQFDIRISQELPGFFADNKATIWLDILNVGNLINKDWGQIEEVGFPLARGVVEFGGIDETTGKYVYRFNTPDSLILLDDRGVSRWSVQLGFSYNF